MARRKPQICAVLVDGRMGSPELLAIPLDLVIWSAAVHFVQRRDERDDDVSEATDRPGRIETSRREGEPSREIVRE